MDRKEVRRTKTRLPKARTPKPRPETVKLWRRLMPYGFMGIVFVLGFLALLSIIGGKLAEAGRIILVAMVLAGAEYYYRRFVGGPSSLEDEFSALSDFFCFAVVPGLLMYQLVFRGWGIMGLVGLFVILFGGLIRLSLYKLYNPITVKQGFIGIPMTITAAFIALVAQLLPAERVDSSHRLGLLVMVTGLIFLSVSTIRYPNPTERPGVFVLATLIIAAIFFGGIYAIWAAWLLLGGGAAYLVIAPFGAEKRGRNHA